MSLSISTDERSDQEMIEEKRIGLTETEYRIALTNVLRNGIARKGISIIDLSKLTGIAVPTLYGYVNGKWQPSAYYLRLLCVALDLNPETVLFPIYKQK